MYTDFFRLSQKPFSLAPDPRFMFMSASHREALAHVLYGIEEGHGFIEVVGQVGTGKTTLCRALLEQIGDDAEIAFIFNPSPSEIELLAAINREFGLPTQARTRTELVHELNQFLLHKKADGRRVLLIIDEAQNLEPAVLEQIRLLSNLETDHEKLIQILLLGQPELEENLNRTDLRQLRQRITVSWKLRAFAAWEVGEYIEHRLAVAGQPDSELFTRGAVRVIHMRSRGIPRLINSIADRALLLAYSRGTRRVTARLAARAARELPASEAAGWRSVTGLGRGLAAALVAVGIGAGLVFASLTVSPPDDTPDVAARPGTELAGRLVQLGSERSSQLALASLLHAWDAPQLAAETPDPSYYPEALRTATRLRVLATDAQLEQLLLWDLPAILELEAQPGERRWAALVGASPGGRLKLALGDERFEMDPAELATLWNGRVFVFWHNWKSLPVLEPDMTGSAVRWVQARLADLGYLRPGDPTGEYDSLTIEAVRRFQIQHRIDASGTTGPQTLIALYQALDYATPRLMPGGSS